MKKHLLFIFFTFNYLLIIAQPSQFSFTPTFQSGSFVGTVTVNGNPASTDDWIASFDENGNCCGAAMLIENEGITYCNFPIYGDDPTSPTIDEGMNGSEKFTLQLYHSSINEYLGHPNFSNPYEFNGWISNNGAPIPAYSDAEAIFDFSSNSNINENTTTQINVFPNPTSTYITLNYNNITDLVIFNSLGKIVEQKNKSNGVLKIIDLAKGNYFITFKSDNKTFISKFIKE